MFSALFCFTQRRSRFRTQLILNISNLTYRRSDNGNQIEFHYPCIMSFFFSKFKCCLNNVRIDTISLSIYNTSYLSPTGKYYLPINKYEQQSIKLFYIIPYLLPRYFVLYFQQIVSKLFRCVWLMFYCTINRGVTLDLK